jgi:CelD/BcsL family acetyltransferase involved in cellulose biosynthesis
MSLARPDLASAFDDLSEPSPAEVAFTTITDASSFEGLEAEWDELVRAMPRPSPYLLHGWLCEWWRHYGDGRRLCIHVGYRDGRLVAALPLCVSERGRARTLEFLGGGTSALADLLLADGENGSVGRALAERAAQSGQHFADLFGLTSRSRLAAALGPSGLRLVPRVEAPVLDLSKGWESVYEEKTSSKRRNLHRRRRNQLAKLGKVELSIARSEAELATALEHAFDLYARRWCGRPDNSDFTTPTGRQFERSAVRALAAKGVPQIVLLKVDDRPIAFFYCLALAGRMYAHKLAFDPAFGRCSPGVLTVLDTLELASEEGLTTVEFLGGAERFKVELADRFDPLYEGIGLTNGPLGPGFAAARVGSIRLRARMKASPKAQWLYHRGLGIPRRLLANAARAAADHG